MKNEKYADYLNKANGTTNTTALSVKMGLEMKDYYYVSPAFNGSSQARDQVGIILQKGLVISKSANIDAELKKIFQDAINECENAQ